MEQALRATKEDGLPMRAGKFAAGTTLTVTTVALAAVETILSAAATLATLTVSYFVPGRYAAIKTHTADSARTMALAAKRTFGAEIIPANQKVAPQVASSRVQKLQELVKAKATTALQFSKENKTALIASAIAVTVVSAYYFGLFDYAASLVQSAPAAPQAKKAVQVIAKKAAALSPMGPHLPSSLQPVVSRPDHTFIASKAAAKLFTEGQSGMVVSDAYSKLLTEGKFPKFVPLQTFTPPAVVLRTADAPLNDNSSAIIDGLSAAVGTTLVVAGAIFKGVAATGATAVGSIFVAGTLME